MSTFSLTRGSEAALGMLASQAGSETLLLTQPARELRASINIEPFTSLGGNLLRAELFVREQRHSMTLQRDDGANAQHLADWIEAVANGTLDTAEAIPQRADPSDLAAAPAAFHAAAHELNARTEPAPAQDEREYPHEAMDKLAIERYRVCAAGVGTLHRFAVQAGDGEQELYRGSESDCQNVARKLAGAFLDGGLAFQAMIAAPIAFQSEQTPVGIVDRLSVAAGKTAAHFDIADCPIGTRLYAAPIAQTAPLRYTNDGSLAECPCCGSLDVGGAHDTVHCYRCGLTVTKPRPLKNAIDAWNMRTGKQTAPQPEQSGLEQALALAAARLARLGLNHPVHSKAYREARDWADEAMVALRDYRAALATSPTA